MTHFSPQMVATVETRTSTSLPSIWVVSWPSCGRRRSTMFMPAMILIRLTRPTPMEAGSVRTSFSAPSMRKRTLTHVLGRLDVHVGGPVAHGLGQDAADDLDDRCVVGNDLGLGGVGDSALLPGALHRLEGLHQAVDAADGPVVAVDGPLNVRLRRQHESDRVVVRLGEERPDADRRLIGDSDLEAVVVERDGYRHVLPHDLLGDQLESVRFRIVPPEVDDGHVQQIRQKEGQLPRIERAHRHQGLADPLAGLGLDDEGLGDVGLAHETTADQEGPEGLGADRAGAVLGFVDGDGDGQPVSVRVRFGRRAVLLVTPDVRSGLFLASEFQRSS